MYMAMTGARMRAADCIHARICDAYVPADKHDALIEALAGGGNVDAAIENLVEDRGAAPLAAHEVEIDRCFAGGSVEAIEHALEAEGTEWAEQTLEVMAAKSPTSQKIAFRQLREGRELSFDECMVMEFRMSQRVMAGHDFFEGVRTTVIDRDDAPEWRPATLAELDRAAVDAYFAPLGDNDLTFPDEIGV